MKAKKEDIDIINAVLAVRSANPQVYADLVKAMRAHAMRAMQTTVMARADLILHYQGRAVEALELSELFEFAADHLQKLKSGTP